MKLKKQVYQGSSNRSLAEAGHLFTLLATALTTLDGLLRREVGECDGGESDEIPCYIDHMAAEIYLGLTGKSIDKLIGESNPLRAKLSRGVADHDGNYTIIIEIIDGPESIVGGHLTFLLDERIRNQIGEGADFSMEPKKRAKRKPQFCVDCGAKLNRQGGCPRPECYAN